MNERPPQFLLIMGLSAKTERIEIEAKIPVKMRNEIPNGKSYKKKTFIEPN